MLSVQLSITGCILVAKTFLLKTCKSSCCPHPLDCTLDFVKLCSKFANCIFWHLVSLTHHTYSYKRGPPLLLQRSYKRGGLAPTLSAGNLGSFQTLFVWTQLRLGIVLMSATEKQVTTLFGHFGWLGIRKWVVNWSWKASVGWFRGLWERVWDKGGWTRVEQGGTWGVGAKGWGHVHLGFR